MKMNIRGLLTCCVVSMGMAGVSNAASQSEWKFAFGKDAAPVGFTQVGSAGYSADAGFGIDHGANGVGATPTIAAKAATSDKPFYFSAAVPEGNYRVTLTLGDSAAATDTTVKAELRRLMLLDVKTTAGQSVEKQIVVNVRHPEYVGGAVHLKGKRESDVEAWAWDDKLTLEFNGSHVAVQKIVIEPADVPTLYILGDSTVCDQPSEPWTGWGQVLPSFFKADVAVANEAESGETLKSSEHANRLAKVLSTIKAGDYLFIQYGHNDMKDKAANALETYGETLKKWVGAVKAKGGTPVLVTSMNRKSMDKEGHITNTLLGYPDMVRKVAKEEGVALIDLHAMSKTLYEAVGAKDIGLLFKDGTHHVGYGAFELAQCILDGIKEDKLPLAGSIREDWAGFDPAKPDAVGAIVIPTSPVADDTKPAGN